MESNQLKGKWNKMKGKIKEKWGELTDDELQQADGKKDVLLGMIQEKYGIAKEEAEREYSELEDSLG